MKRLMEVILIGCCLVLLSRSSEGITSTSRNESTSTTTTAATTTTTLTPTQTAASENTTAIVKSPKDPVLPIDVLSPEKVLLDPNVILARIARDTYGGWNQGQRYGGWNERQRVGNWIQGQGYDAWGQNKKPTFDSQHERRPFGIEGYYRPNGIYKPEKSKRRSDVRRIQATQRPFRIYPVFPG